MKQVPGRRISGFVVLFLFATVSLFAQRGPRPENCEWKCERTLDTASCLHTYSMGGSNCSIVPTCTIVVVPTNPPSLSVTCTYDCQIDYCVWV